MRRIRMSRPALSPRTACAAATALGLALALPACSDHALPGVQDGPAADKPVPLTIEGYNYTDRYIASFTVNGQGGGNLAVSSPTSGGGGGACCVSWTPGSALPRKVLIRWVGAYCKDRRTNSAGETRDWTEPIWREAEVMLHGPVPAKPTTFEVHFYNGGKVEVAITERPSPPRLQLPRTEDAVRPGITFNDPPCTDEQRR